MNIDPMLGDLAEEYALRVASRSRLHSLLWYCSQLLRSIPRLAWWSLRRAGLLATASAALGAFIVASIVELAADTAVSKVLASGTTLNTAVSLVGDLAAIALGGYLAALVRPAAAVVLAAILFTLVVVFMVIRPDSVPVWYQIAFLIGGPLASLRGGALCRQTR